MNTPPPSSGGEASPQTLTRSEGKITAAEQRSFLKDEYLLLQQHFEDYDRRSLTIKGWISGGSAAGLGLAFNSSGQHAYLVPVSILIISASIWYLEARWKVFQSALAVRIRIIEAFFRDDPDVLYRNPAPFQIYHWWFKSYVLDIPIYPYEKIDKKANRPRAYSSRTRHTLFRDYVCIPYVPIIALCILSTAVLGISAK